MALVLRPGDQQIMFKELGQERDRMAQFGAVATPELAERVGALHKQFPSASGGVLLSSARSGMPDVNVAAIVRAADGVAPPKKKSLWQKAVSVLHTTASQPWRYLESQAPGVAEGIKDVSRVTFAGLEFSLQAVQNVGSNRGVRFESDADLRNIPDSLPFSENILDEGFMVSTDLGATLTGRDTGSGFFFGGEAKQFQEEMVRAYRGTTPGGEARSGGRSSAGMVFTEGSVPYNLASGFIDGVLALGIPATGIKTTATAVKGLAAADDAGAIVKGADRVLDVVRGKGTKIELSKISGAEYENARLAAGVLGDTIDPKLVNDFIGTRGGIRLMERLVDANTASAVRREIGQNVYPETIQLLRDAKDFNTVRKIVIDILGLPVAGISRTDIRGTNLRPSNLRSIAVIDNLVGSFEASRLGILTDRAALATGRAVTDSRTGLLTERAFEKRASRAVVDFSSENPVDIRRSLNDMDRWMAKSLVDPADRVRFMDQALDAMTGPNATPTAQRKLKDDFQELVKASWVKKGPKSINEDVANAVMTAHLQSEQAARTFNNSLTGALDDGGAYMALDGKNANVADGVLGGPQWQGELGKFMVEMPDAGQVRALTGRWNRMWRKGPGGAFTDPNIQRMSQAGKLRLPFAGIRFVQEMVWRRGILATGGYAIRNLMEGQMSLALSQKPVTSLFRHPWEHLQVAAYRKMSGDILGEDFSAAAHIAGMKDYQHAVGVSISSQYVNPADVYRRGSRAGEFNRVKRGEDDIARVVEAHGDLIGKMNDDPVGRLLAAGADDTEILEFIRNTPEGQKWFRWQQDYSMNGRPLFDQTANKWADPQVIDLRNGHNMRLRLQELRHNRDLVIGGHPALAKAVETGLLPPVTVDVRELGWDESFRGTRQQIPIGDGKDFYWARVDADDESIVRPFAFADGESSKQLTELLERPDILTDRTLAQTMVHETRRRGVDAEGLGAASTHMMDRFFGFIMGKPTAWLERSPAFKQRYYSWAIDEMVTSLSPVGLDEMITTITRKATELGVSPSQYVGDSGDLAETVLRLFGKPTADNIGPRWARLLDLQANPDKLYGTLDLADIDMYAKGAALDDLSKMLYDASERNNLIDVARWIAPFGQAQLEFYRRLSRIYTVQTGGIPLPNLEALRKTQFMIENGREADPDGNGRGFFYKDEQTGDMMFDYPMSSVETKWLTGLSSGPGVAATATAPLKGAILGFDFKVGIGPVAQIAASLLLQDKPEYDFMRRALLPYGETDLSRGAIEGTVSGFIPAWTEKLLSAFFDSEESSTAYGNAFMEVFQALGASGEYDMADPNERDRARQDAKPKARALTVIRAVGQWFGPSRPTLRLGVDIKEGNIKEGNVLLNVVSQHFRELELEDPDTAVARFEDLYGADMMVALMRKTKSNVGGLQASVKFGDFERDNPALFRKYKSVAGYFVEGGTDWDWIVYGRQLKQVKRERLTTEESWLAAETLVGWSKWRVAQDLFNLNPNPTKEGREAMKEYRGTLDLRYPGFADMTIKPNKINNLAIDLRNAVKEPGMVNNPVALAATRYLNARDGMLYLAEKQYGLKTLRESTKTAALRAALRAEAQLIIETYPDFARLYQQLFEREIEE